MSQSTEISRSNLISTRKTVAVLIKEVRHILRSPGTLILLILAPVLLMIITGYALATDIEQTPITVMDRSRTALSRDLLATLANNEALRVDRTARSYAEIEGYFNRNQTKGAVIIPPDFAERIAAGEAAEIQLLVDGTDPTTAEHVINHVISRSRVFGQEVAVQVAGRSGRLASASPVGMQAPTITLKNRTWYNPGLENTVGIVPALLPVVLSLPAIVVMNAIVREKEAGTLELIFATPLGRSELIVGKLLPYVLTGLFSAIICLLVAVHLFDVPFRGSLALYLLLTVNFLLATFSVGLLIANFVSNQAAAAILGLLFFIFPGFFLTGVFYPVSNFPAMVQREIQLFPATHFVAISRGLLVKGQGLDALWRPGLKLLGLALGSTLLTVFFFRKKLR